MAIVQISKIQQRRGLNEDLPALDSAELGWSIDTRQLYIGNGTIAEGAPSLGQTEILTEYSIINFTNSFTANFNALQSNVATITAELTALGATPVGIFLPTSSSGNITAITANNATINYSLTQGSKQRTGTIRLTRYATGSTVSYDEEYDETATTDVVFSVNANTTQANLNYTTTTASLMRYTITSII